MISLVVFSHYGLSDIVKGRWQIQDYDRLRFSIQSAGFIAGLTNPFGVGPGGWPNTHSLYVRTLAEQGIIGLLSLGLLISALLFPLIRTAWVGGSKTGVITDGVLLAMLVGQLINSLVIDSIHWRHLWLLLGLVWAFLDIQIEKE